MAAASLSLSLFFFLREEANFFFFLSGLRATRGTPSQHPDPAGW